MTNLEDKIRIALPRLKELTKGCIIIKDRVIFEVIDDKKSLLQDIGDFSILHHEKATKKEFRIIGHPIKLNDVLQYLTFLGFPIKSYQYNIILKLWFLDSVLLADQSDELKGFLNSL